MLLVPYQLGDVGLSILHFRKMGSVIPASRFLFEHGSYDIKRKARRGGRGYKIVEFALSDTSVLLPNRSVDLQGLLSFIRYLECVCRLTRKVGKFGTNQSVFQILDRRF